jgi:hypothetical protein
LYGDAGTTRVVALDTKLNQTKITDEASSQQERTMPKTKTQGDFFATYLVPQLKRSLVAEDAEDLRDMRRDWKKLEKIPGIQTLIVQGDHKSVCQIYKLYTTLD